MMMDPGNPLSRLMSNFRLWELALQGGSVMIGRVGFAWRQDDSGRGFVQSTDALDKRTTFGPARAWLYINLSPRHPIPNARHNSCNHMGSCEAEDDDVT